MCVLCTHVFVRVRACKMGLLWVPTRRDVFLILFFKSLIWNHILWFSLGNIQSRFFKFFFIMLRPINKRAHVIIIHAKLCKHCLAHEIGVEPTALVVFLLSRWRPSHFCSREDRVALSRRLWIASSKCDCYALPEILEINFLLGTRGSQSFPEGREFLHCLVRCDGLTTQLFVS